MESGAAIHGGRAETVRVSTLELFFDLVFVFTATQVTAVDSGLRSRSAGRSTPTWA